ncbi:protein O-GlcNAc transferase [Candidatus Magnetomoraceae bacterium gMMP-15]
MSIISNSYSLGAAVRHHKTGHLKEAEIIYNQILADKPDDANALHLLGVFAYDCGKNDLAVSLIQKAISYEPCTAIFHYNLGLAFQAQNRFEDALKHFQKALDLKPDYAEARENLAIAHNNFGIKLKKQKKIEDALKHYQKALKLRPDFAEIYNNIATAFQNQGYLNSAIKYYKKAISLFPEFIKAQSNLLFCLNYHSAYDSEHIFKEHLKWGKSYKHIPCMHFHSNLPDTERPLRLAYVSPDFHNHPVAYFIEPILANHDPLTIETVCYSDIAEPDALTMRLKSIAGLWRNTSNMTDKELIRFIRYDGIDILVDLAGHSANNRLMVFAEKPAPLQVTYLGYPNTTGLSAIDYRITDSYADPPGKTEKYYSEKLIRLPHSFFCCNPPDEPIKVSSLPALKNGHISFGAFHNFAKCIYIIDLWISILKKIPDSHLIIQSKPFGDKEMRLRVLERFLQNGIEKDRIEIAAFTPFSDYLRLHNHVDIILDTFPWNGHTTSCHALWMGVPVITLAGNRHAARLGLSLLSSVGFTEWIARTEDEYVQKAVHLASDFEKLAKIRQNLRQIFISSVVCNGKKFTQALENIYRRMWKKFLKN